MRAKFIYWTRLGLGAVAVGSAAACGGTDAAQHESTEAAPVEAAAMKDLDLRQAVEGEGGESGEGGIDADLAATDAIVFGQALAVAEAHIRAANDAYAAGEKDAATEMFGHPVGEVLADMEDVFAAQGVGDLTQMFLDASDAAYQGVSTEDLAARSKDMLEALEEASLKAPDDGRAAGIVAVSIVADQIERSANMYREAKESDRYEPYLDGYGFYKTAAATYETNKSAIAADAGSAVGAIEAVLGLLDTAYPSAGRGGTLDKNPAELAAASSRIQLALSSLE